MIYFSRSTYTSIYQSSSPQILSFNSIVQPEVRRVLLECYRIGRGKVEVVMEM